MNCQQFLRLVEVAVEGFYHSYESDQYARS